MSGPYSNSDIKTAFYFIGSINLLAAMNFLLVPSEEEKLYQKIPASGEPKQVVSLEPMIGPIMGLRLTF